MLGNETLTNDQINDLIRSISIAAGQDFDGMRLIGNHERKMLLALIRLQVEKTGIEYYSMDYRTPLEMKEYKNEE